MKLAVLGAGAWGTAISISLATRNEVTLWARDPALAADMQTARVNARYLPAALLPTGMSAERDHAPAAQT